MSSSFGSRLAVSIFGQSHSTAVGVTMDGFPAGFAVDWATLRAFLARRAPGRGPLTSSRREPDEPEALCGFVGNVTCGSPIALLLRNADARPEAYDELRDLPRPGHADYTGWVKSHGFGDASGGGHFSGRLTAPLCAAGGLALQYLAARGIAVAAHLASVAGIDDDRFDPMTPDMTVNRRPFPVLREAAGREMEAAILAAGAAGDSVGGTVECAVTGLSAGLGDPMFDGMENRIARIVFGIPAVKGLEFGSGFPGAALRGSEHNDAFLLREGRVVTETNRHGGILGGITTGMPLLFRVALKPTPSIALPQRTVNLTAGTEETLRIRGRHDPCVALRAVPCMEAAAGLAVLDALLEWEGTPHGA